LSRYGGLVCPSFGIRLLEEGKEGGSGRESFDRPSLQVDLRSDNIWFDRWDMREQMWVIGGEREDMDGRW